MWMWGWIPAQGFGMQILGALGRTQKQEDVVELIRPGDGWFHREGFKCLDSNFPEPVLSRTSPTIIYSILTFIHLIILFVHLG